MRVERPAAVYTLVIRMETFCLPRQVTRFLAAEVKDGDASHIELLTRPTRILAIELQPAYLYDPSVRVSMQLGKQFTERQCSREQITVYACE